MDDINRIHSQFTTELNKLSSSSDLQKLRNEYLGRKGAINSLVEKISSKNQDEKKKYGQSINALKNEITASLDSKKFQLNDVKEKNEFIDVTLPGIKKEKGSLHIMTYAIEEISRIFERIGFIRASYPEIEWEYFSFDALNMQKDHPARDDFETFFIDAPEDKKYGKMVLTPHTSSGQYREMLRLGKPPIRMINIAKTYRPNWDASHTPMFHQFEGMCVDEGINITHLKGTIEYFAKQFFGENREIRLRPFHFQFTEPSFEVDITCGICQGTGVVKFEKCKLCKAGWLELGGAGMVHPNVLTQGGVDPEKYTGWAFGFGVERVFMMKEGMSIDDIRILYSGDIRFLEQF